MGQTVLFTFFISKTRSLFPCVGHLSFEWCGINILPFVSSFCHHSFSVSINEEKKNSLQRLNFLDNRNCHPIYLFQNGNSDQVSTQETDANQRRKYKSSLMVVTGSPYSFVDCQSNFFLFP